MTHPLKLHEIRTKIGSFLEPKDLINCACVSKEWNSTFNNLIWNEVILRGNTSIDPTIEQINAHSIHIRSLLINNELPRDYFLLDNLSRLNSLAIQPQMGYGRGHNFLLLRNFIKAHSTTLQTLHWIGCQANSKTFSILGECRQLTTVWLEKVTLPSGLLSTLFDALSSASRISSDNTASQPSNSRTSGLTTLYLGNILFMKDSGDNIVSLSQIPSLKYLHLRDLHLSSGSCLNILDSCPNLESFSWRGIQSINKFPLKQWISGIKSGHWTHLTSLDINDIEFTDSGLAIIIRNIASPLSILRVKGTGFGQQALRSLLSEDRHYNHIKELELFACVNVTSPMIQQIMVSMPALVYFSAGLLLASDILRVSDENQDSRDSRDSREWVCTNLRTLRLCIDMENELIGAYREHHKKVHQRLGVLEKLEILDVSRTLTTFSQGLDTRMLIHSLSNGLDYLGSMKKLREFIFKSRPSFTLNEAEWLFQSWKSLAAISGPLSLDVNLNDELEIKLSHHGIIVRY